MPDQQTEKNIRNLIKDNESLLSYLRCTLDVSNPKNIYDNKNVWLGLLDRKRIEGVPEQYNEKPTWVKHIQDDINRIKDQLLRIVDRYEKQTDTQGDIDLLGIQLDLLKVHTQWLSESLPGFQAPEEQKPQQVQPSTQQTIPQVTVPQQPIQPQIPIMLPQPSLQAYIARERRKSPARYIILLLPFLLVFMGVYGLILSSKKVSKETQLPE